MVLSDPNRIDIVSQTPSGEIVLSIVAPEPWSDTEGLLNQLTDKLCTYLAFMNSREYKTRFGDTLASIQLCTAEEPPEEVKKLIEATSAAANVRIDVERIPGIGGSNS